METHVALSTGVTSVLIDHITSGTLAAAKSLENLEKIPEHTGAAGPVHDNFDRHSLLSPISDRGTLFDTMM